ncbi:hypothetical protein Pcinc_002883 [Petrolisthes cinctipes]|uniref:Uncharacterized protein n=1 Tax=Petrolisthes cinctipes TaxID=88211 RepID=A0AAE1GPK7_PETCI|nr:hypothetical protein Pcinc_002883 [Petrolisthes cinctipes]
MASSNTATPTTSVSGSDEVPAVLKVRKRPFKMNEWKMCVTKRLRNEGEAYVSRSTGMVSFNICKRGFCSVFGIGKRRVEVAVRKLTMTATPESDQRGAHSPTKKKPDIVVECVCEHIRFLPTVTSHYTRAKSPHRRYLSTEMSLSQMYELYCMWMDEHHRGVEVVKNSYYNKVFNTRFNLGFAPVKMDTCNCDRLGASIMKLSGDESKSDELESMREELAKHKTLSEAGQAVLTAIDKGNKVLPDTLALCFDLQQTLLFIHAGTFTNVDHYFLMPGHSFMPCDRHFANIEQKLRKHATIITKHDYVHLIKYAIHAYKMGYKIRLTYASDAPTHTYKLQKSKARTYKEDIFSLHTVDLVPKYTAPIPLTAEKIKDLKSLLEHIAPRSKGKYFEDILRQQ